LASEKGSRFRTNERADLAAWYGALTADLMPSPTAVINALPLSNAEPANEDTLDARDPKALDAAVLTCSHADDAADAKPSNGALIHSQALCAMVLRLSHAVDAVPVIRLQAEEALPAIQSNGAERSGQDDWNSEPIRLHPPCRRLAIPSQAAPAEV